MWNIVKVINTNFYDLALIPEHPRKRQDGYVYLHRAIVENHLGRLLEKDEVIHHRDGDRHNNTIENLQVVSSSEHTLLHHPPGRTLLELVCDFCGKTFSREVRQVNSKKKSGQKHTYCSRQCIGYGTKHLMPS